MDQSSVRNLERIQEQDEAARMPRAVSVALLVLGGASIALAVMALGGKQSSQPAAKVDPLGELVSARKPAASIVTKAPELSAQDVTFPSILSDDSKPTTALAAVRGSAVRAPQQPTAPPPPGDALPVVPLPAQNVMQASPVITRPRDELTRAAADGAQASPSQPMAPAGHEGAYQLQVSSFRTQQEADGFASQLRERGHKAYVVEAKVPGRGTWYRVRVGPFGTQAAASAYRSTFEAKEHVVPFVVPPSATAHREGRSSRSHEDSPSAE
jgi:DedD protein